MGVSVDGGEDSKAESAENEEAKEEKKWQIFERTRAIIVGDLKILRLVFFGFGDGSYGWFERWI